MRMVAKYVVPAGQKIMGFNELEDKKHENSEVHHCFSFCKGMF